jgi:hypothetical protein
MFRDPSAVASPSGRSGGDRESREPANADSSLGRPDRPRTAAGTGEPADCDSSDGGQNLLGLAGVQDVEIRSRLDRVREHLEAVDRELAAIASDMISFVPDGACRAQWAACAHCLGSALDSSTGGSWCPSCGRPGTATGGNDGYLCSDRATVTFRDTAGNERNTCLSHAAAAFGHIRGLTLVRAEEHDVEALISVLHTPLRVNIPEGAAARSASEPGPNK